MCASSAPVAAASRTVLTPSPAVAGLEAQLAQLFATARAHMLGRAAAVHPDLSPSAFKVISALVRGGPCHAVRLSSELAADKSVISRLVRQLEDLGLVERRADPDDGRAFVIAATPVAVRKVEAVRDESRGTLHRFLAGWDEADIRQLTELLARLNEAPPGPAPTAAAG